MELQKLSVIIVTYNAMNWAERCFSSLRKSVFPVHTIVVDNGSTDGTQNFIKNNFPEVEFIKTEKNLGFGLANNLGIESAYRNGADFFYLMNQDAWVFEDSFGKLVDAYNSYLKKDEIAVMSPLHLDGSEKAFDLHFEMYLSRNTVQNRIFSDLYFNKAKEHYEMNFVNAAHWFIPKHTIELVGGFSPYFFQGAEDHDYINRAKFFKKKVILCPYSSVVHDAKKGFERGDTPENIRKKSILTQRENLYLNPSYDFDIVKERRFFLRKIVENRIKGYPSESEIFENMRKHFSDKEKINKILKYRSLYVSGKHPFLNLEK